MLHNYTFIGNKINYVVTTNQYNDEIDMPPTKKSQTFSPPNTTEGERIMIVYYYSHFLYRSPDTARHPFITPLYTN